MLADQLIHMLRCKNNLLLHSIQEQKNTRPVFLRSLRIVGAETARIRVAKEEERSTKTEPHTSTGHEPESGILANQNESEAGRLDSHIERESWHALCELRLP